LSHQWDEEQPRLLVCEAKLLPKSGNCKMSMPLSEPSAGASSSRRGSSTTMTMLIPSGSDKNSKVSDEEFKVPKIVNSIRLGYGYVSF
jgi:hypothetical protein